MTRRHRYDDRRSAGSSKIVPFQSGEQSSDRHERRLSTNLSYRDEVKAFCQQHSISLRINNGGHHWILVKEKNRLEWWPSSAKMVWNQQWSKGIHVHDYQQFIEQARRLFGLPDDTSNEAPASC